MSGPSDTGIRNRGKTSTTGHYSSPSSRSPVDDLDDDHGTTYLVCDTYQEHITHTLTHSLYDLLQRERSSVEKLLDSDEASVAVVATLTALAFALRFYKINHPDQVV